MQVTLALTGTLESIHSFHLSIVYSNYTPLNQSQDARENSSA
jgi:hypothetical protein